MNFTFSRLRVRKSAIAALGLGVAAATVLAGCDSGTGGTGGTGGTLPTGASAEEYQAALADMEPVELIVQSTAASAGIPDTIGFEAFLDRVTEYSGGKITFDVTYANGIVPVLETDDALVDGRVDIVNWWPQYDPSEYPASNVMIDASVVRDPRMVTGYYSIMAAMQEVALDTPEIVAEYTDKGITPLNIMSPDGPSIIACSEPINSLADLAGKQIRAGGTVHARQIEELGAIPVSLPYPEVYEALQRGILDCSFSAHAIFTSGGHLEVAPYVYHTETTSLASTPTNWYAGPRLKELPVAAQQLILESAPLVSAYAFNRGFERITTETYPGVLDHNGGFFDFPADVETKLAEINEGILADVAETTYFDGADFVSRLEAANEKWIAEVNELGYTDNGTNADFPNWFTEPYPVEPWYDAVVAEIVSKHLPS